MPVVPRYDNFQTSLSPSAQGPAAAPQSNAGEIAGVQLQQLGAQGARTSQAFKNIIVERQQQANRARVFAASTEADRARIELESGENGYANVLGEGAAVGVDGQPLADYYTGQYAERIRQINESLGNDAQREMFNEYASRQLTSFQTGATRHEIAEVMKYEDEAALGVISSASAQFIGAETPEDRRVAQERMLDAIAARAQSHGWAPAAVQAYTESEFGKTVDQAVAVALENGETDYALSLFDENKDKISGEAVTNITQRLGGQVRVDQGLNLANEAMHPELRPTAPGADGGASTPRPAGTRSTPVSSAEAQSLLENGLEGITVTSTDRTRAEQERLRLAGYPTARGTSDHELNRAIDFTVPAGADAEEYMVRAVATLTAQGYRIRQSLVHGEGSKRHVHIAWETDEPAEDTTSRQAAAAEGSAPPTLAERMAYIDAQPNLDPRTRQIAYAEVTRQYNLEQTAKRDSEEQLMTEFYGVAQPGTTYAQLPSDLRTRLSRAGKTDDVMRYLDATSDDHPNNSTAWVNFLDNASSGRLNSMTANEYIATYRDKFDDAHFERGMALIADARSAGARGGTTVQGATIQSPEDQVRNAAIEAGILPPLGQNGQRVLTDEDELRYNRFEGEIQQRVLAFEQGALGSQRKANPEEIKAITDAVIIDEVYTKEPNAVRGGTHPETHRVFEMTDEERARAYVRLPGGGEVRIGAIPPTDRAQIVAALVARGTPVTEAAIARLYAARLSDLRTQDVTDAYAAQPGTGR